ncbi:MAG: HdeD family acid-resistance protein [Spirulina sp.]
MIRLSTDPQTRQDLKAGLTWVAVLGILMMILGVIAALEPLAAGVAIALLVGVTLLIFGIFHIIFAFVTRKLGAGWFVLQMFISILYLIAGGVLLKHPFDGLAMLTLLLGILIFIEGVIQTINAFDMRPRYGWGWSLFSGITAIVLGILIWSNWPASSRWAIGIMLGVNLITSGLAAFMLSGAIRSELANAPLPSESALNVGEE